MKFDSRTHLPAVALFLFSFLLLSCSPAKPVGSTGTSPEAGQPPLEEKPTPTPLPPSVDNPPTTLPPAPVPVPPPSAKKGARLLCQSSAGFGGMEFSTLRTDVGPQYIPASFRIPDEKNIYLDKISSFQLVAADNFVLHLLIEAQGIEQKETSLYQIHFDLTERKVLAMDKKSVVPSIDIYMAPPLAESPGKARFLAFSRESSLLLTPRADSKLYQLQDLISGKTLSILNISATEYFNPLLSADGKWVTFQKMIAGYYKNFLYSVNSEKMTPLPGGKPPALLYPAQIFDSVIVWVERGDKGLNLMGLPLTNISSSTAQLLSPLNDPDLQTFGLTSENGSLLLNKVFETYEMVENSNTRKALKSGFLEIHSWNSSQLQAMGVEKIAYPDSLMTRPLFGYEPTIHRMLYASHLGQWIGTTKRGTISLNFRTKKWKTEPQDNPIECFFPSLGPDISPAETP